MQLAHLHRSAVKAPFSLKQITIPGVAVPAKVYREYKIPTDVWAQTMDGNDTVGDCIIAMIAHWIMCITAHTGTMIVPTQAECLAAYSAITGYDPNATPDKDGNNPTDNGTTISDLMQYMMSTGIAGVKILAWGDVDITNIEEQKLGIYAFGGTLDAANLPQSAVDQFNANQSWSVIPDDGGIVGGHGFVNLGFGSMGTDGVSWAKLIAMLWPWRLKYMMETAVAITPAWFKAGIAPNSLNMDALNAILASL